MKEIKSRRWLLLIAGLALATVAWAGEIAPFTTTVPTPPTGFQNPYKYIPPPGSFVPNAPWSANVLADSLNSARPPDGAICVTGQGKVVASYNYYISNYEWRISVSTDAGAHWTSMTPYAEGFQCDNVLGSNQKDSVICYAMKRMSNGYNHYFMRSTDSGVTWSDTLHVPQAATGTFPDHPILAARYPNILVTYYDASTGDEGVVRSTNWGDTWNSFQIHLTSSHTCQGGCPAFAPAPSLVAYAVWGQPASWQPNTIWFNKSTDLGATWGTPQKTSP